MEQPELGRKIVDLRKAKGLTQDELVRKCNLSVRTLQRIESGEVTPRSFTIKSILAALDYEIPEPQVCLSAPENASRSVISYRLEQLYKYLLDLFNLKTNTMKKLSILSVLTIGGILFLSSLTTNAQNKTRIKESLLGTWQLCDASGKTAISGNVRYKVITPETFVVLELNKDNHTFSGDFVGNYSVNNDGEYTESISYTYSNYTSFQNAKNTFKVEFKDDLMYMKGVNNSFNEVWKKVSN